MRSPTFSPADIRAIGLIQRYGKLQFTLSETAQILNRGTDGLSAYLHDHGITVKRIGRKKGAKKLVDVYDLAELIGDKSDNVAAIRND